MLLATKSIVSDASQCSSGCADWGECINAEHEGYKCNTDESKSDLEFYRELCESKSGEFIYPEDTVL